MFWTPKTIRRPSFLALGLALLMGGPAARAQSRVYTYVNETGLRVITNIPPPGMAGESPGTESEGRALASARAAEGTADRLSTQSDQVARRIDIPVPAAIPASGGSPTIDSLIRKYADHYQIQPDLIRAVIKTESNFNPRAVSPKGARGLMQLMPETALRYGVRNIFDPEQNIAGGVKYLNDLLQMFNGNIPLALSAYNAGENLVARIQKIPNYKETRNYVSQIGKMFDFDRTAYLAVEEPAQPRLRVYLRADGVIEITNINSSPASNVQ